MNDFRRRRLIGETLKPIERSDLRDLVGAKEERPCISIYMPVYRHGTAGKQNPIRFKNLLKEVEGELKAQSKPLDVLTPLRTLSREPSWWIEVPPGGLAFFVAPGFWRSLILARECEETMSVGDRFLLAPLLRYFAHDGRFYLIAVAKSWLRLYEGDREMLHPVYLPPEVPTSVDAIVEMSGWAVEKSLQHHAAPAGKYPGTVHGVIYGQGHPGDVRQQAVREYLTRAAARLQGALRRERAPIVVAGVGYVQAMFRSVFHHPYLLDDRIHGNPDAMDEDELWQESWPLIRPWFERTTELASRRYAQLAETERTTEELERIIAAADAGRVDTLFLQDGARAWGKYDPRTGSVSVHQDRERGDMELCEFALEISLGRDGEAFVLPPERMPSDEAACAILRW